MNQEQQEIFDNTLLDNIYFAETKAYVHFLDKTNAWLYDKDVEQLATEDIPLSRYLAEEELLNTVKYEFAEQFYEFTRLTKKVYTKVNGKGQTVSQNMTFKNQFNTDDIVGKLFTSIIKKEKLPNEESLGFRVYSIVKSDISKADDLLQEELLYDSVYAEQGRAPLMQANIEFQQGIIEAGKKYIKLLYSEYKNQNSIIDSY